MIDSLISISIGLCVLVILVRQASSDAQIAELTRKHRELEAYALHAYATAQFNTAAMRRHEADEHRQEGR